jgi:hypothetical protein
MRYKGFWQITPNDIGTCDLELQPEVLAWIGPSKTFDVKELEYASIGEPALTVSGIYGAISASFPVNGEILYYSERGHFVIALEEDISDLPEKPEVI